jgi:catechol 2,3-dioxygenase-like lactoylglutathione lyase family enzyme
MEVSVGVLDHYNVSTRKLKETVRFYEDVLGFVNGPSPQFNFPGAWLYSAGHPVLHLNNISQTDKRQPPGFRRHRSCCVQQPRLRGDEAAPHRQGRALSSKPSA